MVWSRTLGDLATDIADRVDLTSLSKRHPPNTIRRRLIESYQRLREWVTDAGSNMFVGGPYLLSQQFPSILDYGCSFPLQSIHTNGSGQIDATSFQPPLHVRRVEAKYLNGWREVARQSIFSADSWLGYSGTRYPREFFVTGQGLNLDGTNANFVSSDPAVQAPATFTDGQLRIVLMPYLGDGSVPIRVYGMPSVNIVDDYQTVLTLDSTGFDWLIYDAALKLVVRDNDSQGLYQMVQNERATAEATMRKSIARELSVPVRRRDVCESLDRYRYRRGY